MKGCLKDHPLKGSSGNSILEMLLFTPLALLLLIVSTDIGLAYKEKSSIVNAIRSSFNLQGLTNLTKIVSLSEEGKEILNSENIHDDLNKIIISIAAKIEQSYLTFQPRQSAKSFNVAATIVRLTVDSQTGRVIDYEFIEPEVIYPATGSRFSLLHEIPDFPLQTKEQFIVSKLDSVGPAFAQPIISGVTDMANTEGATLFLEHTYLIYLEVQARARGISKNVLNSLIGRHYGIQEQQLIMLRAQLS